MSMNTTPWRVNTKFVDNTLSIQEIKNKIEVNDTLIRVYQDIACVSDKIIQMRLENIELRQILILKQ